MEVRKITSSDYAKMLHDPKYRANFTTYPLEVAVNIIKGSNAGGFTVEFGDVTYWVYDGRQSRENER